MGLDEARGVRALVLEADFLGPHAAAWVDRLKPKLQEIGEAALALITGGDEEGALELASAAWRLWMLTGEVAAGRRTLATVLATAQERPGRARAMALYAAGVLAFRAGDQAESKALNEQGLAAARGAGDREAEALALVGLSRVALRDGDYQQVRSFSTRARQVVVGLEPSTDAAPLHLLAAGTRLAGDYGAAADLYAESLRLNRDLGDDWMVGMELLNLGHVELHRGNLAQAERCFAESASMRGGNDPYQSAMTFLSDAALAVARGQRQGAAELLDRTQSTLEEAGIVLDPDDAFEVRWLREQLGSTATGGSRA
jgi:tetratricopeptide (TPR) repeat protein